MKANYINTLYHLNATLLNKAKIVRCLGGTSLSLVSLLFAIYFFNFLNLFARFVILSVAKNPQRLKENLPFLDTSLSLSMTNSGFCLKMTDKENALCHFARTTRQKFKFFTQNSKHFINSTHFITLSQILSHTQGFFISLPQIFYIFTQIAFKNLKNSTQRSQNDTF